MINLIPWEKFEEEYAKSFCKNKSAPALSFRGALAALIIQKRLGISDRETVEQIRENSYLQYFIGLTNYQTEAEGGFTNLNGLVYPEQSCIF
ncbi:hypothetical protein NIES3804_05770 [Microcystis aeruginosa NIES-3804]|uniref:Transposase InsH N-terminal domain-containing protein n=1 Tax=Microcystis aeruginosa NIES-3804 TaxID=2517783 RepID=A0A6H9GS13_MICAE|nr:hypothetical protein NIES3804_05770 [Microcystis aeruginosa NIES-3804]